MSSEGQLFILSAPSGSGKTSLADGVLQRLSRLRFSISYTTRTARRGERDGVEYFFVSRQRFREMIERQEFLEFAQVYGHYYGTSARFVQKTLASGMDVLLDIDVQGAAKVKRQQPAAIGIFVLPPSWQELERRLRRRGLDDAEVIESRLRVARQEIQAWGDYDYVIVNQDVETAIDELRSIVVATRCRIGRQVPATGRILETFEVPGKSNGEESA